MGRFGQFVMRGSPPCSRSFSPAIAAGINSGIFVSARRQSMPPTGPSLETYGVSLYNERPFRHPLARRSEEHTSELQSRLHLVCRLLLEKKKKKKSQLLLVD